jgi:hypothetical protein
MKVFAICFFLLVLSIGTAMAGKPGGDIPITQEISDVNTISGNPYYIQSDGLGPYLHTLVTYKGKTTGTNSVLMANVCGSLPNGDRLLETTLDTRKVKITLTSTNAIKPGEPHYLVPAQFFGTINSTFRGMNKCTCGAGLSMYAMAANTRIFCPMHFRLNAVNYRLDMGASGEDETEFVEISCKAADSSGCKEWSIDPISDPDYTDNPGVTRARLVNLSNGQNLGDYYMTFHLHVTRP